MPRVSNRQKILKSMRADLYLSILMETSSSSDSFSEDSSSNDETDSSKDSMSETDKELESSDIDESSDPFDVVLTPKDIMVVYTVMDSTRYFVDRPPISEKSRDFVNNYFANMPDKMFRQMTRMDKHSFFALLNVIQEHSLFHNNSTVDQAPVSLQLAVTLDRFGHDGNGACFAHLIPTWGVSIGSLQNFTSRCFTALKDCIGHYLKWPTQQERAHISEEFAKKGFFGCVGLIDGTLIPLAQRPGESGECYFDRKSKYSVNAQVVCDHRRKIMFLSVGLPGTVSDLTCLKRSKLWRKSVHNPRSLFDIGQYILGDAGYQSSDYFVAAFKKYDQSIDKEDFNTCVAKARVINEHCIGVLKSRWFSLKGMRIQLKNTKEHLWFVRWITICARLHNFVMSMDDQWSEEDSNIDLEVDEFMVQDGVSLPRPTVHRGRRGTQLHPLQERVMTTALAFNREPGGCLFRA